MPAWRKVIAILLMLSGCAAQVTRPSESQKPAAAVPNAPATTTAATSPTDTLVGTWRIDTVESGDPLVAGDHPWSLTSLTIAAESYLATRVNGTTEHGPFSIVRGTSPAQVLFHHWGHRDDPRRAAFDCPEPGVLRICMFTKEYGEHNCLIAAPSEIKLPPAGDAGYWETVLYTLRRE